MQLTIVVSRKPTASIRHIEGWFWRPRAICYLNGQFIPLIVVSRRIVLHGVTLPPKLHQNSHFHGLLTLQIEKVSHQRLIAYDCKEDSTNVWECCDIRTPFEEVLAKEDKTEDKGETTHARSEPHFLQLEVPVESMKHCKYRQFALWDDRWVWKLIWFNFFFE